MDKTDYEKFFEGARTMLIKFAEVLVSAHEWYERNAENIAKYLLVFADFGTWCSATDKLAEKQVVFTDDLTLDFAKQICNSTNIDELVQGYYFNSNEQNMTRLIERCEAANEIMPYKDLYAQTIDAYKRGHYHLACIGMFSLLDGVLADVSEMISATNFKQRIGAIEKKINDKVDLNDVDRKTLCIYTSTEQIKDSMFGHSDFEAPEPDNLNRHWIIHGRTRKAYSKYDFLKITLWLDAISYMAQLTEQTE